MKFLVHAPALKPNYFRVSLMSADFSRQDKKTAKIKGTWEGKGGENQEFQHN